MIVLFSAWFTYSSGSSPTKKRQPQAEPQKQNTATFGYEEMLTELEAIVADAELRLEDEEAAWKAAKSDAGWRLHLTRPIN